MKPILFSTLMVQAILDGRKTMTRRVLGCGGNQYPGETLEQWCERWSVKPKYQIGDVLWVRETWGRLGGKTGYWLYRADYPDGATGYWHEPEHINWCDLPKWRPSIFMPREAARIFLRVTDVRAERLQDITAEDVISEGLPAENEIRNPDPATHESIRNWNLSYAQYLFQTIWDKLNDKRGYGWDKNPFCWVISFERVEMPKGRAGMREILFRGKRIDNGEWVYGHLRIKPIDGDLAQTKQSAYVFNSWMDEIGKVFSETYSVDPDTVGQFTGLMDKTHLTKVFEGDVVSVNDSYNPLQFTGYVTHKDASFCIAEQGIASHYRWMDYDIDVIGNIFDNPELIKSEEI